jgi:hypothetical protein
MNPGGLMKRSVMLFVGAVMIVMFQNCAQQNVDFNSKALESLSDGSASPNGSGADTSGGDDSANAGGPSVPSSSPEFNEQFKVSYNNESAPLDMIWVIDNSGSMNEEAAAVRKNFDAFLTALNKNTDFRLLLVSSAEGSTNGVSIPSSFSADTHKQIVQKIGSLDGPSILVSKLKALPAGFLRANSKKIIVFVTDDNSNTSAASFLAALVANQSWSEKDVSVSSFIGLSKALSPCMAAEGVVYKTLASQTNGKNYNICQADWSSYFSDLINVSVAKAVRRFSVAAAADIKEVVEVKVDGVVLDKSLYSVAGKTLTLSDSVSLAENSQVSLRYK